MPQQTMAVIGAGTMGRGLALVGTTAGLAVRIYDVDTARARAVADEVAARDSAAIVACDEMAEAVFGVDVVVECVPELVDVKAETLARIAAHVPDGAIVATNTSTMSIAKLSAAAGFVGRDAGQLVGLHFFNPAERMRLVEIVRTADVSDALVARCERFVAALGKTAIVVKDSPGFVTSRLGLIMGNEAMRILEDGIASAEAVDTAMRLGYNHPMGPLELADLVGLDARLNNVRAVYEASGKEAYRPPEVLEQLVAAGKYGRKSGEGFYRYDADGRRVRPPDARDV